MAISVFLSTVSDEFRAYRDQLNHDLARHNVAVKVQEDFKDLGGDTLDKLEVYIAHCDAVVHLVGDMCGAAADDAQQQALLAKHPKLSEKLPPLGEALKNGLCLPYTQWEAWLALYHGKPLMIATAAPGAPRGPKYAPDDATRASQAEHLKRLKAFHRYPGSEFRSPDELAKQIAYTAILDLLAEERSKKTEQAREPTKLDEILKIVSEKQSVPLDTLRAILDSMGEAAASYNAAEIEQKLEAKASEFRDLTDRLNRLSNVDPVVAQLRREASSALASGSFERADKLLADAEARDLSGLEDIEALARQKRLSAADSRAQRAGAALLRINPDAYRQAAAHYGEASRIAAVADALKAREYLRAQAAALARLGDEFGDNAALREAISLMRTTPGAGDRSRDKLDWAAVKNDLGIALMTLGQRESGIARLEEAVEAFHEALEERTRGQAPLQWAVTQNNLGNALRVIGEREGGTARLEEAAAAFNEALKEQTRERASSDWARAQFNLASVLVRLGERETGTGRLQLAVAAFRAGLKERTRGRDPLLWAMTQNNLGSALKDIGEREEEGRVWLEEAVEAFRAALEERTRERVPLLWAATQNNLGTALMALGRRESGTLTLEQAVAAYRKALQEWTRERASPDWASAQSNLGNALIDLGKREDGIVRFEEAVAAFDQALKERPFARTPRLWARSFGGQGVARALIAERANDRGLANAAIAQLKRAYEAMVSAGDERQSAYLLKQLAKAQAIRDRLKGK
jgi:tetratricopeptide (TPR) repeat protein